MKSAAGVRERDSGVLAALKEAGRQSLRKLGNLCGLSKDQVQRGLNALKRKRVYAEAELWESPLAQQWLRRLLVAVIVTFVLEGGAGAERVSTFLRRARLDREIASSPTALRTRLKDIEDLLAEYGKLQEQAQKGKLKQLVAGGDETFFREQLILVLMELSSGYILLEEINDDRRFDTWQEAVSKRLGELGGKVRLFTSDRGKALIKLALEEFGCDAGADLFHAMQNLVRWQGLDFQRKLKKAEKAVQEARAELESLDAQGVKGKERDKPEQRLKQEEGARYKCEQGRNLYRAALHGISKALHPFTLDSQAQTSEQAKQALNVQIQELEQVARDHNIADRRGVADKFRRQISDLTGRVSAWWLWAGESLAQLPLDAEYHDWVQHSLLPVVYWDTQAARSDTPELRLVYRQAQQNALLAWQNHPLTKAAPADTIKTCQQWAQTMTARFQRSSSAIEGRNGCLAQMYHSTRGLNVHRLRAATVLHNFACRRADGLTPAERLFGSTFPDLFEWLLERTTPLPVPRQARSRNLPNPLNMPAVAG